MSRTRRLSLRARMLVMLIGVTTLLLLVMGTVSTYLFVRRVDAQEAIANRNLILRAKELRQPLPKAAQYNEPEYVPSGEAVVEMPLRAPAVIPLTKGTFTTQLARALARRLDSPTIVRAQAYATDHQTGATRLIRIAGCAAFPHAGCTFTLDGNIRVASAVGLTAAAGSVTRGGPAVIFVGAPASTGASQVRGFIIAELLTGAALIALLAVAGEWLIGRGLVPLDQMTRTANEITSQGDLTARMPEADDQTEVGRLGSSINTMLDRIQQAFGSRLRSEQKVREFAADASHELRTPLTTIRGYAELYRQGALGPDQLPNAMRRIEQEAERMSTLVAELLELARLDRTSSLDLTETDLAGVIRDAVADAIAVEPERPVHAEAPPRLVAVVDEPRIRQVLANLLGNVRAHTPVTTPVAVRLGTITGGVLVEVADGGPGMSTQDAIRAFDRFHRAADRPFGDTGEDQDQGGNAPDGASPPGDGAAARWLGGAMPGAAASPAAVNGAGLNGAGLNGANANGAARNGAGLNGADVNGAGVDGAGVNRADLNGAGVGGAGVYRADVNGAGVDGAGVYRADVIGAARNGPSVNDAGTGGSRPYLAGADAVVANGAAANGAAASGSPLSGGSLNGSPLNGGPASGTPLNGGPLNGAAAHNGSAIYRGQHRSPAGSGRADRTSGSGLGLSIVQAIANAHGGRATLESVPGQGTKVRVWLPVRIVP